MPCIFCSEGSTSQLASKTGDDATNEFATGKAVFYQNGSWAYADLTKAGMTDDQLGMLPIYIGVDGEENQGLCSGGENYWCVSSQASEALEFLHRHNRSIVSQREINVDTENYVTALRASLRQSPDAKRGFLIL